MSRKSKSAGRRVASAQQWTDDDFELAVEVAQRYYRDGESKVDIAEKVGLTRFQVGRILQESLTSGVVRIEIRLPGRPDEQLGRELSAALGIDRAVVVDASTDSYTAAVEQIGTTLAQVVAETVNEGDLLGLAWSRTIDAMSRKLSQLRPCSVVQLAGHLHIPGADSGSVELVRRTASISGGNALPIYAPMVVPDSATAEAIRRLPEVSTALETARGADIAVASVGSWRQSTSQVYDALSADLRDQAAELGVVGEVAGRTFDAEGESVSSAIDERVVAVTLEELRAIPHVIISGFGDYRAAATVAALRATGANTLVTDVSLARAILG